MDSVSWLLLDSGRVLPGMFLPKLLFKWHLFVNKQELRKVAWHFLVL